MIDHLNNLLRHPSIAEISEITTEQQVHFEPPDEHWRDEVTDNLALNVYLVDLRENRSLRSNERSLSIEPCIAAIILNQQANNLGMLAND